MTDWRSQAACRDQNPEIWFPTTTGDYHRLTPIAMSYCQPCPVRLDCLRWALETDQRYGIWGALTEHQRDNLRRRERRASR